MLIEYKVIAILLYSIICQVHVEVIKVAMLRSNILLSSESSQPLLVNEDSKGIDSVYQGINSQIKFETIYKIGFTEISLRNVLVALLEIHILKSSYQKYSFALAKMHRFDDESLIILLFVKL